MEWYDNYLNMGKTDRSATLRRQQERRSAKRGREGIFGPIAKSGKSAIVEVLSPGQRPTKRGLITPRRQPAILSCGTQQVALHYCEVFTTGRGTPYGLMAVPVIKMATCTPSWRTAGLI
ncbi:hypothetical protein ACNKHW_19890 [Shigella flexneri]